MDDKLIKVLEEMSMVLEKKSNDYGNSWKALGLKGLFCQIHSKYFRLKNLLWLNKEQKVKNESVRDSLVDLANYCILSVALLDDKKLSTEKKMLGE